MGPEVALITGVASSLMGFMGSRQEAQGYEAQAQATQEAAARQERAAMESRRIEERNAARLEAETAEAERQEYKAQRKERLTSVARAAASGGVIAGSGSTKAYLDEQEAEHKRALDFLERAGESQVKILRDEARARERINFGEAATTRSQAASLRGTASTTRTQGFGRFVSGLGSSFFDFKT